MKILHIGISEHLGGIETYLYKIASNIDLKKYQFDFLTYPGGSPCYYDELIQLGCKFQRVTPRKKNPLRFRKEFDTLLKKENYDIVHCHLNSLSFTEPISLALKNKEKVIAHSRNGQLTAGMGSTLLHNIHYRTLKGKNIERIAVSDIAGKWMFGDDADCTVLNNGVDLKKFHYLPEGRANIRKEFQIGDRRLLIHTGAFRPQKNHEFLIDVFAEVHKLEPDTMLMLVGSGSLEEIIQDRVHDLGLQEYVIFAGQRNDIPSILSAGDLFLFPSLYEGFPNAMIEAEATGLFCIIADSITKQAGINGLCEYVSLKESPTEWARTIHEKSTIQGRDKYTEKIREAGLDVESEIRQLTTIYDRLLKD